ncbi:MAG: YbaY family lipoprotein [Candidatus Limnocylindrales bacterium]
MVLLAALVIATGAPPIAAATGHVTGTLTFREKIGLSGDAVAVVSIVDMVSSASAGIIVGQQRIDGIAEVPVPFSIEFDVRRIDPRHAYGLFATLVDGPMSWQNPHGIAVLTGGPMTGVDAVLALAGEPPATIVGTITTPIRVTLGPDAVAIAALVKKETGTIVNRQVLVAPGPAPIAFSIGFDPSVIDPRATYLVKAALVDGGRIWDDRAGAVAITAGVAVPVIPVLVSASAGSLPVPSSFPSAATPSSSPPGAVPSGSTAPTSSEPSPSGSSTAPTSPPSSLGPTPTPTSTPQPTPIATPRPSPAAGTIGGAPRPAVTGVLIGTLDYPEPHQLSADAVAVVVLVRGSAGPNQNPIVATQIVRAPAATPVAFRLVYEAALIDRGAVYSIQAAIVDGTNAWATGRGRPVATTGASAAPIQLVLAYRPDLVKGEVIGSLTGAAISPTDAAYAVAVLIDPATGQSLGMDLLPTIGALPAPFSLPFSLAAIDPARDYLVNARIVDAGRTWQNPAGVPVITRGNPIADVQVVVAEAVAPGPSPGPGAGSGSDIGLGIVLLVLALIVGAAGVFLYDRSRVGGTVPRPPADPGTGPDPTASGDDPTTGGDAPTTAPDPTA